MFTEKDFLLDVVALAPAGTVWAISKDCWDGIPHLFGQALTDSSPYHWSVRIQAGNRDLLAHLIAAYDLPDKIVQMSLTAPDGTTFFTGEDHLDTIILDFRYPGLEGLQSKYEGSELGIVSKEALL